MKATIRASVVFALASISACGLVPRHPVLPYPDHVQAGIEEGDKIEVTTRDGYSGSMTVVEVTNEEIVGENGSVAIVEIDTLERVSWSAPRNPCDDGEPLGCSVPIGVRIVSDFHDEYAGEFKPSCRQHDFCYRMGYQTYGLHRSECDEQFLQDMLNQCKDSLFFDPVGNAECSLAAQNFYDAVDLYGDKAFRQADGQYCEYAGPPSVFRK